jgi:hypothetical protein
MLGVVRHERAVVGFGDGGNDHVDRASRAPSCSAFRHQVDPNQAGSVIEWKHAVGKQGRCGGHKPLLEFAPLLPGRLLEDAALGRWLSCQTFQALSDSLGLVVNECGFIPHDFRECMSGHIDHPMLDVMTPG